MTNCYPLLSVAYETLLTEVGNRPGTYRLRLWDGPESNSFTSIGRLLANDVEGVLYIGTAEEKVVSRVATLQHAVGKAYGLERFNPSKTHTAANAMREAFVKEIDASRLCIELTGYDNLNRYENYVIEWKILEDYFRSYGEFPPMNGLKPSKSVPTPPSVK